MQDVQLKIITEQEVLGKQFKIYGTAEDPLFLAKDVAEWIEYDKSSINKLLNSLDNEEKVRKIVPTLGGAQEAWLITEDGLYEVLMQSRKPIAKQFKSEVKKILKSIRTKGGYIVGQERQSPEELLANAVLLAQNVIAEKQKLLEEKDKQLELQALQLYKDHPEYFNEKN